MLYHWIGEACEQCTTFVHAAMSNAVPLSERWFIRAVVSCGFSTCTNSIGANSQSLVKASAQANQIEARDSTISI